MIIFTTSALNVVIHGALTPVLRDKFDDGWGSFIPFAIASGFALCCFIQGLPPDKPFFGGPIWAHCVVLVGTATFWSSQVVHHAYENPPSLPTINRKSPMMRAWDGDISWEEAITQSRPENPNKTKPINRYKRLSPE